MKAAIDVQSRREGDAIRIGLEDPIMRAMVLITGALRDLPSDRARERVMRYVADQLDDENGNSHDTA